MLAIHREGRGPTASFCAGRKKKKTPTWRVGGLGFMIQSRSDGQPALRENNAAGSGLFSLSSPRRRPFAENGVIIAKEKEIKKKAPNDAPVLRRRPPPPLNPPAGHQWLPYTLTVPAERKVEHSP